MVCGYFRKYIPCEIIGICTLVHVNHINQIKNHSVSVDQARYTTSIVEKYLDTATVKTSTKFYKTALPSDIIFAKADAYTSDEKIEKLAREFNIYYRDCILSLIYFLSTRVNLSFDVHKLANFHQNLVKYNLKVWYIH